MSEIYYRHSGQFSVSGAALGLLFGLAGSVVLAPLYAYLVLYIPIAGYITFIIAAGFGALVGFATGSGLHRGRVRNTTVSTSIGILVALAAWYLSWAVWVFALLRRNDVDIPLAGLFGMILQPGALWELVGKINETGAWTLSGSTPTGAILWFFWFLEALLILVPAVFMAMAMVEDPFCERCSTWCSQMKGVATVPASDAGELKARLERRDLGFLEALGRVAPDAQEWFRLDLHQCPAGNDLHTLTAHSIKVKVNRKGERSESTNTVVRHLLVDATEAQRLRQINRAEPVAATA